MGSVPAVRVSNHGFRRLLLWKRHVRLGGIGLPSILGFHREGANCIHVGCMVRSPPFSKNGEPERIRVHKYVRAT